MIPVGYESETAERIAVRTTMWRDLILAQRGPGTIDAKCPTCFGAGELHGKTCHRCFPEDHPPHSYLVPRTPDPERADQRDRELGEEIRADDERSYQESTGVDR